jgi:hypothetical protein
LAETWDFNKNLYFSWGPILQAETYLIEVADGSDFKNVVFRESSEQAYTVLSFLKKNKNYFLRIKPKIKIIGLQKGEKLHEELFDGPVSPTKFNEISRSEYSLKTGLVFEAKSNQPINNLESVQIIDSLVLKYCSI